jgi:hypothetical protein
MSTEPAQFNERRLLLPDDSGAQLISAEHSARRAFLIESLLVTLGAIAFAVAFTWPILHRLPFIGLADDWAEHLQPDWAAYYTITHFHQVPLWNPYRCGGMPLLAHPLSICMSPLFLVQLILGPFIGVNLQIPIHIAIGWLGGYILGRCIGLGAIGSIACATIFPASSWYYLHLAIGHLEYLPGMYMPLTIALLWFGIRRQRAIFCMLAGLLLALTLAEGGVYQCTRVLLLAGVLGLYLSLAEGSWAPIWGLTIFGFAAIGFGAIKLFPCWYDVMRIHPRPIAELEFNPISALLTGITTRDQFWDRFAAGRPIPGAAWAFFEWGAYVSVMSFALAAIGLVTSPRRAFPWLIVAALFFVISIGGPQPWYPWAILHHLPLFSSERVPERCLMGFVFGVGVIAGFGADFLARRISYAGIILASSLIAAILIDAWLVNRPNLNTPAETAPPSAFGEAVQGARLSGLPISVSSSPEFRQFWGSPWEMVGTSESNMGSLFCNEGMTDFYDTSRRSVVGFNQAGYFGEQFLVRPGSVNLARWTPNVLTFDIDTPTENVLMINQVYDSDWRVIEGSGEVISAGSLIGVKLPPGHRHLRIAYRSDAFRLGALVTLVTFIVAIVVWRREKLLNTVPGSI